MIRGSEIHIFDEGLFPEEMSWFNFQTNSSEDKEKIQTQKKLVFHPKREPSSTN
jgi:hypothetical protein